MLSFSPDISAQQVLGDWVPGKNVKTYRLDEYTRFPALRDYFTEFVRELRYTDGHIRVLVYKNYAPPSFGENSLVLLDGIPVISHQQMMEFPPEDLSEIIIYQNDYLIEGKSFNGIVNFVRKAHPSGKP